MENRNEVWRDIQGYSNYQISNLGRVWSAKSQRLLKPSEKENGYYGINLIADNGKRKKEYVHRLVALVFIDNPNNFTEVHHKDGNRANNTAENLEWSNRKEHMLHHGCKVYQYDCGKLVGEYDSIAEAAMAVGGTRSGLNSYFAREGGVKGLYLGYEWTKEKHKWI